MAACESRQDRKVATVASPPLPRFPGTFFARVPPVMDAAPLLRPREFRGAPRFPPGTQDTPLLPQSPQGSKASGVLRSDGTIPDGLVTKSQGGRNQDSFPGPLVMGEHLSGVKTVLVLRRNRRTNFNPHRFTKLEM